MNRISIAALLMLLTAPLLSAQPRPSLPTTCQAFRPAALGKPSTRSGITRLVKESETEQIQSRPYGQNGASTRFYWVVYSDRADNKAYTTSSGNVVCAKLSLGQKVTIAKIENDRALVYEDKTANRTYPEMPTRDVEFECFGWVPMSNLLLWDSCPTDKSGIYNKALLSVNVDAKNASQLVKEASFKYTAPSGGEKLPLQLDEKIYYIMKRSGNYVLLSTHYSLESAYSDRGNFIGWVKEISYIPWNQRLCLEPTWKPEDVEYFVRTRQSAGISDKRGGLTAVSIDFSTLAPRIQKWNEGKYKGAAPDKYRWPGYKRRFPLLSIESGWYKVSSFSRSSAATGISLDSPYEKSEQELKQLQNINLVLLIDGTKSMDPFYPAVRQGLLDGCGALSTINKSKIKVCALIYRDKTDGQYEIEPYSGKWVQPNDAGLHAFLTSGGSYGIKSNSKDKNLEESLYLGMETALSYFNGKEKQSNILLVVGDCGNVQDDAKKETLSRTATRNCVQIIGYQVQYDNRAGMKESYSAFADQLSYIMSSSLKGLYASLERAGNKKFTPDFLRLKQDGNRFSFAQVDHNKIYRGSVICPFNGSKMTSDELKTEMFSSINSLSEAIQEQINIVVSNTDVNAYDDFSAIVSEGFLATRGIKVNELNNNDISFLGWTRISVAEGDKKHSYYQPVLFLSKEEFTTLVNELSQVNTKIHAEKEDRKPFIDALTDLASKHFGGMSGQDIRTLSLNEIQEMIYGLPEKSGTLSEFTLEDLGDPKKVSESQYRKILDRFRTKLNTIKGYRNRSDYQGRYEFNGGEYYWIPVEDLP